MEALNAQNCQYGRENHLMNEVLVLKEKKIIQKRSVLLYVDLRPSDLDISFKKWFCSKLWNHRLVGFILCFSYDAIGNLFLS